jgi:hypothetical protein
VKQNSSAILTPHLPLSIEEFRTLCHAVYFTAGKETTRFYGFLKQAQGINKTSVSQLNPIYFTSYSYEIHFAISIWWCLSEYQVSLLSLVHEMFTNKRTVTHPSRIVSFRFISRPNNNFGSNLMFICPCIASISLKYNQQDASRSIYFYKLLYMFQTAPPPIIRST